MSPRMPFGSGAERQEIFTGLVRVTTASLRLPDVHADIGSAMAGKLVELVSGATLPERHSGRVGLARDDIDSGAMPLYPVVGSELTQAPELHRGSQYVSADRRQKMIDQVVGTGALETDAAGTFVAGVIGKTERSAPATLPALRSEHMESETILASYSEAHRIPGTGELVVAATQPWLLVDGEEVNAGKHPGYAAAEVARRAAHVMVTQETSRLAATSQEALVEDAHRELVGYHVSTAILRARGLVQPAMGTAVERMRVEELGPNGFEPNPNVVDKLLHYRVIQAREPNIQ
jgi:hypothetical protein